MKIPIGIALFLLMVFFRGPGVHAQSDDDEVISVDSSIVVINAAVTDEGGKAVRALKADMFRVLEDGVEQKVDSFYAENTPFAAVILLDTSGSMEQRVTLARSAAIQFLGGARAEDFVAIFKFDSKVDVVQDFSNIGVLNDRVFDLTAYGMTVLNDAVLRAAAALSKRPEKRKAIIVLSDGADNASGASSDKALKAALSVNATIYTVDMSATDSRAPRAQNQGVLKKYAEKTGGRFVSTPGGIAMRDAFKRIVEELGQQYTIAYQPANTKRDGKWRAIEVKVSRPNLTIRARKGYNAPQR